MLLKFAERAAERLRPGSRVVTLASPLANPAFRTEGVVKCINSWGDEDAFVNLLTRTGPSPSVPVPIE